TSPPSPGSEYGAYPSQGRTPVRPGRRGGLAFGPVSAELKFGPTTPYDCRPYNGPMSRLGPSQKARRFTESVIREMTRLANRHGAVNLSQGFPDFPAPPELKEAACRAIQADVNQYAVTWGTASLREAIARQFTRRHGVPVDPDTQITVCCGATETMMATLLATVDPGDEVIVFEPFYEN